MFVNGIIRCHTVEGSVWPHRQPRLGFHPILVIEAMDYRPSPRPSGRCWRQELGNRASIPLAAIEGGAVERAIRPEDHAALRVFPVIALRPEGVQSGESLG